MDTCLGPEGNTICSWKKTKHYPKKWDDHTNMEPPDCLHNRVFCFCPSLAIRHHPRSTCPTRRSSGSPFPFVDPMIPWDPLETPLRPLWDPCPFCKMNPFWHRPLQAPPQQRSWKFMFIHRRFATKTARTKCNGFGKSKEFVLPSITLTYVGDCWRMFGHFERFFSTYWALFSSVWGYLGPIWGYVGPIWGYVGPMWAYLRLMLGLCWAYLDPFLAYIGPDQEFWPLLKNMQKHRILEQKSPPQAKAY